MDKLLDDIDESLKDKKETEVYAIVFLAFGVIAFLSYYFLFELTKNMLKTSLDSKNLMAKNVKKEQNFLASQTVNGDVRFRVEQKKKTLLSIKEELKGLQKDNDYINKELKKLRYLLYDEENWSKFIDSISKLANDYKLEMIFIKSKVYELNVAVEKMKQVLDIEVEVTGDYKNILKFINSLEQSEIVTDVYNFELINEKKLKAIIKISVWGMVYCK